MVYDECKDIEGRIYDPDPKVAIQDKNRYKAIRRYYAVCRERRRKASMTTLWIEKYEPQTFEEMVLKPATRAKLQAVMRDCPHVILYGLPGSGKTTFAKVFLKKMKHIYFSGKKGIAIIREEVEPFAKGDLVNVFFPDPEEPALQYVIINEADWLSDDAQAELRMIMEDYQGKTRFAFITNNIDKLQDQIRSRCIEVEFEKANVKDVVEFVRRILAAEGVSENHVANRVNQIWQGCPGDIRRVLNAIKNMVADGRIQ